VGVDERVTPAIKSLMGVEWRDATYAHYAKVLLENCHILDEEVLCRKFGHELEELASISALCVPSGGLNYSRFSLEVDRNLVIPYSLLMYHNLSIEGRLMYDPRVGCSD
jgi:hypothetical protein